jgi:hypothetical protein
MQPAIAEGLSGIDSEGTLRKEFEAFENYWVARCFNWPSQPARPPQISRNECACPSRLAKQHGHEMLPTGEPACAPRSRLVMLDRARTPGSGTAATPDRKCCILWFIGWVSREAELVPSRNSIQPISRLSLLPSPALRLGQHLAR